MNSRRRFGTKLGIGGKTVSKTFSRFKFVSDERLKQLKQNTMKKRTYAKMMWGVNAYRDWRLERLNGIVDFDVRIWEADIDRYETLDIEQFKFALCKFLAEIRKISGEEYPGRTLYHMVVSIQKFLNEKGVDWKLIDGNQFKEVRTVLDNLMKQRASENIGTVVRQAEVISMKHEDELWNSRVLGEDSPNKLRDTVLFLIGLNFGLRAGDEHYDLRRN